MPTLATVSRSKPSRRTRLAILIADVIGYDRLVRDDEDGALAAVLRHQEEVFDPAVARHGGTVVKTMGDGTLVRFDHVIDAVRCAVEVQQGLGESEDPIRLRMGIDVGEVVLSHDDVLGGCVNRAARLERLSPPGGIALSERAFVALGARAPVPFADRGSRRVKPADQPIRLYDWVPERLNGQGARFDGPADAKPSLAVMPFQVAGVRDAERRAWLAEGLADDIITLLSRSRWLFVSARASAFAVHAEAYSTAQAAHWLGVRYILTGSAQRDGDRVTFQAELLDAVEDRCVWSDQFTGAVKNLVDAQHEVVRAVAGALHSSLHAEGVRSASFVPDQWESMRRAWHLFYRLQPASLKEAETLMRAALARDPDLAGAMTVLAGVLTHQVHLGYRDGDDGRIMDEALRLVLRGLTLEPDDEYASWILGLLHSYRRDTPAALAALERAIEINPNCALAYGTLGTVLAYGGAFRRSIENNNRALRLNPRDPALFLRHAGLAIAHLGLGQYGEAVAFARKVVAARPGYDLGHALLCVSLLRRGRRAEAIRAVRMAKVCLPGFGPHMLARLPFCDPGMRERFLDDVERVVALVD